MDIVTADVTQSAVAHAGTRERYPITERSFVNMEIGLCNGFLAESPADKLFLAA